jgi:fibronectin-binding autotransporter adhesin
MRRRAAVLAFVGAWIVGASAHAASFSVTNTNDSGTGSLRKAVTDANASSDPSNTITFSLPASSTITLTSALPDIASDTLIVDVTTSPGLTINGGGFDWANTQFATTALQLNSVSYTNGSLNLAAYQLTLQEPGSGTVFDVAADALTLIKKGTGTTTLPSGHTISLTELLGPSDVRIEQGTFVVDGTIDAASTLDVEPAGALTIGSTGAVTVNGALQSQGPLVVNGSLAAGSVTAQGPFTVNVSGTVHATTSVDSQGALTLFGGITADTFVIGSAGSLVGNAGNVVTTSGTTVHGRVAPSGTAGSFSFSGPLRFSSTSVLDVDVQPGGGDRLDVAGAVTIDPGARVQFRTDPSAYAAPSSVTLVASNAPINGSFALATDYAFLDESFDLSNPNAVQLLLSPNGLTFSSIATTPNQTRVAQHLEAATPGATGDLADALTAIQNSTAAEFPGLLDAIGGESLTAFATARQILAERTGRALHRRVRDPAWGNGRAFYLGEPVSEEPPDVSAGGDEHEPEVATPPLFRGGAWFDALGLYGELDGKHGEADVDTRLYGGTLGADAWVADHVVVGLAAGYARSDVDLDARHADAFGDTAQGALYAGYVDPRGYVSAYGRYAYTFEDSLRKIESSTLARRAHARFDAQDYGAGGELGLTVLSFGGVALQPIAGVDWLRLTEERYTEHGAGDLSLVVDPDDLESTTTRFGGRVFGRLEMKRVGTFVPELRAFYQHLYGDRERVLDARLSGAPGLASIGVRGASLPRESLILGLGWGVSVGGNLTVSFDYDAVLDSDRMEHQGTVAARVAF